MPPPRVNDCGPGLTEPSCSPVLAWARGFALWRRCSPIGLEGSGLTKSVGFLSQQTWNREMPGGPDVDFLASASSGSARVTQFYAFA